MRFIHDSDQGLSRATSEAEVFAIAREYWASVPKWVKCLVPRACHRYPLAAPPDVHRWAAVLDTRFRIEDTFGDAARLRELVDFFTLASARLHDFEETRRGAPAAAGRKPAPVTRSPSPRRESAPAPTDPRSS